MTARHNQQQPLVWMIVLKFSIVFTLLFISDYIFDAMVWSLSAECTTLSIKYAKIVWWQHENAHILN